MLREKLKLIFNRDVRLKDEDEAYAGSPVQGHAMRTSSETTDFRRIYGAATAAISGVISTPDTTQKEVFIDFTVVLTANYGGASTHGDTLDLTALGGCAQERQSAKSG